MFVAGKCSWQLQNIEFELVKMSNVEGFLLEHSSYPDQEQFAILSQAAEGNPAPVRCTKKLYHNMVNLVNTAMSLKQYDNFCVLLNTLRYIVKGSPASTTGFPRLLSFGLAKKHVSAWCLDVCLPEHQEYECQMEGWNKAADDMLFTLTVVINFSEDSKEALVPSLPMLLKCISSPALPGSAKIEATRGSNSLLEVCELDYKANLCKRDDVKSLITSMDKLIRKAGDFELQITSLECLFRLTTVAERANLASKWFRAQPSLLRAFKSVRESFFEVDCRKFLNALNESCGPDRTVYSIACQRAFLGSFELHQPRDEGLDHFWVDFNLATGNMSLYTEDMGRQEGGGAGEGDDMWESVIVKSGLVKEWSVTKSGAVLSIFLTLSVPSHSLLPSLPPQTPTSHAISITFDLDSDPTYPLQRVLGSSKQVQPLSRKALAADCRRDEQNRHSKQSVAIAPILLNPKFKGLKDSENISPIEPALDSPAGKHISSQDSATPPNHAPPPISTPATSTPKPHPLRGRAAPPSSSASRCPPLEFVSGGSGKSGRPKASQSVSGILLGKHSRVVQRNTPPPNPSGNVEGVARLPTPFPNQRPAAGAKEAKASQQGARSTVQPASGQQSRTQEGGEQQEQSAVLEEGGDTTAKPATRQGFVSTLETSRLEAKEGSIGAASAAPKSASKKGSVKVGGREGAGSKSQVSAPVRPTAQSAPPKIRTLGSSGKPAAQSGKPAGQHEKPAGHQAGQSKKPAGQQKKPVGQSEKKSAGQSERQAGQPKKPAGQTEKQVSQSSKPIPQSKPPVPPPTHSRKQQDPKQSLDKTRPTTRGADAKSQVSDTKRPDTKSQKSGNRSATKSTFQAPAKRPAQRKPPLPNQRVQNTTEEEVADFNDAGTFCMEQENTFTRRTNQKKSSPPLSKKQLNSSLSSNTSTASRTALADISNLCLNRGGQRRLFNLSAVQQQRGKKRRNQKTTSNCSSLNSTINSEQEVTAIPDSLPLDPTQRTAGGTQASKKSDVYVYAESSEDSSWEMSPPMAKRSKGAPARQQKPRECKSRSKPDKKAVKSKAVLTSARTKSSRPPHSKFDLTLSDSDEGDFRAPRGKKPCYKSRGRAAASDLSNHSLSFTELRKRGRQANSSKPPTSAPVKQQSKQLPPRDPVSPDSPHLTHSLTKRGIDADWDNPDSTHLHVAPPNRTTRKRIIDEIYGFPQVTSPRPSPPRAKAAKKQRRSDISHMTQDVGGAQRKVSSAKSAKGQKPPSGESEKHSAITPHSRRASLAGETGTRGQGSQRSNQPPSFPVRTLLKEFEDTENMAQQGVQEEERQVEEEDDHSGEDRNEFEGSFSMPYMGPTPPNPVGGVGGVPSLDRVPQAPKKPVERQSRRSSGYHSRQASYQEGPDSPSGNILEEGRGDEGSLGRSALAHHLPRPSQESADEDIAKGFAEICQSLIARSGKKQQQQQQPVLRVGVREGQGARDEDGSSRKQTSQGRTGKGGDSPGDVTLTQLSREIVSKHSSGGKSSSRSGVQLRQQRKTEPAKASSRVLVTDRDLDTSRESELELSEEEVNTGGSLLAAGPVARYSSEGEGEEEEEEEEGGGSETSEEISAHSIGAEMRALMSTIRESLTSAQKQRRQKKASGSVIKRVPEELRELCQAHVVERETVLQAYEQQLGVELERLEKEVLKTTTSESEVTSFLRKKLKELHKSREFQQSQLCRLRGLQQAFHEQLQGLEDSQGQQQTASQDALKKDMYSLRKKILLENQKQEVERIKRSLQAMLMHV